MIHTTINLLMRLEMIRVVLLTLLLVFTFSVNESKSTSNLDLKVVKNLLNGRNVPNMSDNVIPGSYLTDGEILSSTYSDKHDAEIFLVKLQFSEFVGYDLFRCVIDKYLTIECMDITGVYDGFIRQELEKIRVD